MKLRNLKPIVFKEAAEFIQDESFHIMNQLSRQHRQLVTDFVAYRKRTEAMLKQRYFLHDQWRRYEQAYAAKTPAIEAEYAHDERTALSLYDSLVPRLREHRMLCLPQRLREKNLTQDAKAMQAVFSLELELSRKRVPNLLADNRIL